jgi:hypothetical protein
VLAVAAPLDDASGLQGAQPGGEPVAGRAGVAGDLIEVLVAEGDLAHGEQRPFLPDQVQGGRYRAGPAGQLTGGQFLAHDSSLRRLQNQTNQH